MQPQVMQLQERKIRLHDSLSVCHTSRDPSLRVDTNLPLRLSLAFYSESK